MKPAGTSIALPRVWVRQHGSLRGLVIIFSGSSRNLRKSEALELELPAPATCAAPATLEDGFDALAGGAAEAHGKRARRLQSPLAVLAA
jgi:hypothetical protein